ncbi:hypothetical protein J7E83_05100 [Arthrobacter sp. ISL-48]|uniref:hypothetical protein n=1 Tax=Arthrobacter sp. ISL-48 TaxID=2819110 RepID=UPI001BEC4E91|nr:hypothetical protein [Arthrobacter sp. ISL-48]MBT2531515.1 hypothetical protein [Arthrobacter sp. ISL-48]
MEGGAGAEVAATMSAIVGASTGTGWAMVGKAVPIGSTATGTSPSPGAGSVGVPLAVPGGVLEVLGWGVDRPFT